MAFPGVLLVLQIGEKTVKCQLWRGGVLLLQLPQNMRHF